MSGAREIAHRLGGQWYGGAGGYGMVRCPCHDDHSPSLRLRDGERGLLVHCHTGCDAREILAALRRRDLLAGPEEADEHRLQAMAKRRAEQDRCARRKREEVARKIWRASRPAAGTLVEVYLRSRSITFMAPPTIRYHAGLRHATTGLKLPAMVAAVQASDRKVRGLHRTFLTSDGAKAQVSEAKMSLGTISGGAVRLSAAAHELAIGEGIETSLSYQQETGTPTWAALSTSGLRTIVLPELPLAASVVILIDADAAGEEAARAAAMRFAHEGRRVTLARPTIGKDMNDALREVARA